MLHARLSITQKLIHRMLVIECLCFLAAVIVSLVILQPRLRSQYIDIAGATHAEAVSKMNTTMESMISFSNYVVSSPQLQEQVQAYLNRPTVKTRAEIRLTLNHLASTLPNIRGIYLDFSSGRIINSFVTMEDSAGLFSGEDYARVVQTPYAQGFVLAQGEDSSYVIFAQNCYIGTNNCTMTILYDSTYLMDEICRLCAPLFEQVEIVDQKQTVIYSAQTSAARSEGKDSTLTGEIYPNMWNLTARIDQAAIGQSYRSMMIVMIGLFLLMSVSTVLLLTPAIRQTIAPLGRLADTMKKVAAGDLHTVSPIETNDEIGQVSHQFNQMVTELNTYIHRQIETEKLQQKMKYSLLISQINPHFIYNTMGIISILARNGQTEDIIAINNALIKILQDRLRVEHMQISDTVEQEVGTLKQYLLIQRYRYDYHVEVRWEIQPEDLALKIPKNLLQPLVENALFHGLMDEETGVISGIITVQIARDGEKLLLTVADNGRGIEDAVVEKLLSGPAPSGQVQRGRHIGLRNIVERLGYLYPGENCLEIYRDHGTVVRITLPVQPADE